MNIQLILEYLIENKINRNRAQKIDNVTNITSPKLQFSIESGQSTLPATNSMVRELLYNEQQPTINQILLPLLHQSGNENRWLLWITPNRKLSRQWLINSGLPLSKIIQLNQILPIASPNAMEKALASGNYSVVLGWLPELSEYEVQKLQLAAHKGTALGLIMRPQNLSGQLKILSSTIKVHSIYYH
ncbi:SOS-induced cell division inhibitor SulA [Xenorhabdus budapestensis]|uniref:Cell division inhibitor SulA n=1 Tax=Xenorhabdus budapestensis TaxID=290110 RepID=A0ABX7VI94_XENBU|nr:SOS-induced cell division inhibitor SulA [Xenorhabdus budapestensis]QTL38643.1 cell division inhibitor SulA [Xenorhabdus budapestensis]